MALEAREGFGGIYTETLLTTPTENRLGLGGIYVESQALIIQSVIVADLIGNINTFAITNASLEDISGTVQSVPLTFLPNVWTASESGFYFGINQANIRISYDIAGLTLLGNPFNLTKVEAVPIINVL